MAYWLDWFKSWLFKFFHWSYVSAKVHLVYLTSSSLFVTNSVWPLLLIYAVLTMWGVVTIHTIWIVRLMNIQIHVSIKERSTLQAVLCACFCCYLIIGQTLKYIICLHNDFSWNGYISIVKDAFPDSPFCRYILVRSLVQISCIFKVIRRG